MVFRKDIRIKFLYSTLSVVMSIGIISNYGTYIIRLTPINERRLHFKQVINYALSILILFDIFLIFYNARLNYRFRNLRMKSKIDKPLILYLICFPMINMASLGLIFISINYVINLNIRNNDEVIHCLVATFQFISLIILLLDISGYRDTGEEWIMNWTNVLTISVTLISLIMQISFNIILQQSESFASIFHEYFPNSTKLRFEINSIFNSQVINWIIDSNEECTIMVFIVFVTYLIIPLRRNLKHMLEYCKNEIEYENIPLETENVILSKSGSISAGLFIITSTILTMYKIVKVNKFTNPERFIYDSFVIAVYLFLTFLTGSMISEIKCWRKIEDKDNMNLITVFVYAGSSMQCTALLSSIFMDIYTLVDQRGNYVTYTYIVFNIIKMVNTILLAPLMSLIFERKSDFFIKGFWNCFYCSPLILLIDNINIVIHELFFTGKVFEPYGFEIMTILVGIVSFVKPLVILFRIIGLISFGSIILSMIKYRLSRLRFPSAL